MTRAEHSRSLAATSAWLCRLAPIPWIAGIVLVLRPPAGARGFEAAACLVLCFLSLALAVTGGFGLLRHHSRADAPSSRPSIGVIVLAGLGIVGAMVAAMASMLVADLA